MASDISCIFAALLVKGFLAAKLPKIHRILDVEESNDLAPLCIRLHFSQGIPLDPTTGGACIRMYILLVGAIFMKPTKKQAGAAGKCRLLQWLNTTEPKFITAFAAHVRSWQ